MVNEVFLAVESSGGGHSNCVSDIYVLVNKFPIVYECKQYFNCNVDGALFPVLYFSVESIPNYAHYGNWALPNVCIYFMKP